MVCNAAFMSMIPSCSSSSKSHESICLLNRPCRVPADFKSESIGHNSASASRSVMPPVLRSHSCTLLCSLSSSFSTRNAWIFVRERYCCRTLSLLLGDRMMLSNHLMTRPSPVWPSARFLSGSAARSASVLIAASSMRPAAYCGSNSAPNARSNTAAARTPSTVCVHGAPPQINSNPH
eukprot:scaffold5066_cov403-Prasinococcus_capsulatus_cf.AAC.6